MLVQPDADTCTPGHTHCIQFSAERTANVVDLERQSVTRDVVELPLTQYDSSCSAEHVL